MGSSRSLDCSVHQSLSILKQSLIHTRCCDPHSQRKESTLQNRSLNSELSTFAQVLTHTHTHTHSLKHTHKTSVGEMAQILKNTVCFSRGLWLDYQNPQGGSKLSCNSNSREPDTLFLPSQTLWCTDKILIK